MAFVDNLQILQNNFKIISTSVKCSLGIDVRTHELASTVPGLQYIPMTNSFRENIMLPFLGRDGAITNNIVVSIVTARGICTITSAKSLDQARQAGHHVVGVLTLNHYQPTVEVDQITEFRTYGKTKIGHTADLDLITQSGRGFVIKNNEAVATIAGVTIKIKNNGCVGLTGPSTVLLWNSLNNISSLPGINIQ